MGVKKDIGKALNEKLKNIQLSPDKKVWDRIQRSLNAKKRNRLIPFWAKSFGIGLLTIFLGITIYNSLANKNSNTEILKTKNTSSPSELRKTKNTTKGNIGNTNIDKNTLNNQSKINSEAQNISNKKNPLNNKVVNKKYFNNKLINESVNNLNKNSSINNITDDRQINERTINSTGRNNTQVTNTSENNDYINADNSTSDKTSPNQSNEGVLKNKSQLNSDNEYISYDFSDNKKNQKKLKKEGAITVLDSITTVDSISAKTVLHDSIPPKKDIEKKIVSKKESFWDVSFYIIPTYYNSLSKGSSFGNNFINHKKEGGITLSYRVTFDIKLSEKLNLRTGFGKVNLSHTTINVSTTTNTGTIPNLTEFDGISYDFSSLENIYSNELLGASTNIDFKQKIGYFEIPAELVYNFSRKKVKWKIIGGGSVLKITDNAIIAESSNGNYTIGKSNNLSEYSFSANLGGGFDYPLSKKLKINVEPMFKYHIKTFSRETANFKPYSFSVFIGATYKF